MVAEFRNGGFTGLYNYDLIEFPPSRQTSGPSARWPKLQEIVDGDDDADQRGLEDRFTLDAKTQASRLSPKMLFPTASQCLAKDMASATIRPESIVRPAAPQFQHFQRYRFMYSFSHVNFDEGVQASKEDMIEACKKFPLANWEDWSFHPKEYFLRWMMTEMGATMARIHKDPVQPCPGLGDGYKIWLQWESERQELGAKVQDTKDLSEQIEKIDAVQMESIPIKLFEAPSAPRQVTENIVAISVDETIMVRSQNAKSKRRKISKVSTESSTDEEEHI